MKGKRFGIWIAIAAIVIVVLAAGCSPRSLSAPEKVTYTDGILSWQAVSGAEAYSIEIDGQPAAQVTDTQWAYTPYEAVVFRVRAMDAQGHLSPYSEPLSYVPDRQDLPLLGTPAVLDVDGNGLLSWTPVPNAEGYRIWLNNAVWDTAAKDAYQYTLPSLPDGGHMVQVQALAGDGYQNSGKSSVYKVTVKGGRVVPPALSAVTISFDAATRSLVWQGVRNAIAYDIVADDTVVRRIPKGSDPMESSAVYRVEIAPTAEGMRYCVVAVADSARYQNSASSNVLQFPLPPADAPTGLRCTVTDGVPCLTWDAVDCCNGYRLLFEDNDGNTFSVPVQGTRYVPTQDGEWRVSVCAEGDNRLYSTTVYGAQLTVTVQGGRLTAPALAAPTGLTCENDTIRFDQVSYAAGYRVRLCPDGADEIVLEIQDTVLTMPTLLADGYVYVYVQAVAGAGYDDSPWSYGTVYIPPTEDGMPDGKYLLTTPAPRFDGLLLRWQEVEGADRYLVEVDGRVYTTTAAELAPELSGQGQIAVRVAAVSDEPDTINSPWSQTYVWSYPSALETPTGLTVQDRVLSWNTVTHAAAYRVRTTDGLYIEVSSCSVDLVDWLAYDGTYQLQVQALADDRRYTDGGYSQGIWFEVTYEQIGTEHKPYIIDSVEDLTSMKEDCYAYYRLACDLSIDEITALFDWSAPFYGTLDGGGHTLHIATLHGDVGLLGVIKGGTVRDLQLIVDQVQSQGTVGALAGTCNDTVLENVTVKAAVQTTGFAAGGMVGHMTDSQVTACTVEATVIGADNGTAGLLCGVMERCEVTNCVLDGTAQAQNAGGLCGVGVVITAQGIRLGDKQLEITAIGTNANAGLVCGRGTGQLTAVQAQGRLTAIQGGTLGGVGVWQGDCDMAVDLTLTVQSGTVIAGGLVGRGDGSLCGSVTMTVTQTDGAVLDSLVLGTACGQSDEGVQVDGQTSLYLHVQAAAAAGHIGGVIGQGQAVYDGLATGLVYTKGDVQVGRHSGEQPTDSADGWTWEQR